jgi:hypothetical protein
MRTFTIAAALLAAAFTGFVATSASANGGGGPDCGIGYHWNNNSYTCISNRAHTNESRW